MRPEEGALPSGEALARIMRAASADIRRDAALFRRDRDSETLHRLHVTLRRLQAAWALFGPILPPDMPGALKAETRWIGGELGPARDLDVFMRDFPPPREEAPGDSRSDIPWAEITRRAGDLRLARAEQAAAALASERFDRFLTQCDATQCDATQCDAMQCDALARTAAGDDAFAVLAAQVLDRLRRRLRKRGRHLETLDATARHHVRIRAKTLRYVGELALPAFADRHPRRARRFIEALTRLQTLLGALNDRAAARRTALAVAGRSITIAFALGRLVALHERDEAGLLKKSVRSFEVWRRLPPFWDHG